MSANSDAAIQAKLAAVKEALGAFETELGPQRDALNEYKLTAAKEDKLRTSATNGLKAKKKQLSEFQRQLEALSAQRAREQHLSASPELDAAIAALQDRVDALQADVRDLSSIEPGTGSFFVRLFLGRVNVKVASPKDRELLRDEYNRFKDKTNLGFIIAPLVWLLNQRYLSSHFSYTDWIYTLTHLWLLYYYTSLGLRENILRANGSAIRPWWIIHHYLSALISILMLTWPSDSKSLASFLPQFTVYFLYQGIVQFAQARYQKSRHYALRAMGKAGAMDVSHTETLSEFNSGLWSIVLLVVVAQGWQVWNGVNLFWVLIQHWNPSLHWYQFREELQCAVLGGVFIVVGICNFYTTIQTLLDKGKRRRSRTQLALLRQASSGGSGSGGKMAGLGSTRSDSSSGSSGLSSSSFLTPVAGADGSPVPVPGAGAGAVVSGPAVPLASPESKKDA